MRENRILDGTVKPLEGHFEEGNKFYINNPDISLDEWRRSFKIVPIRNLGNIAVEITDLPYKSSPDHYDYEPLGDYLDLGFQWYTPNTSPGSYSTCGIFLQLHETLTNTEIETCRHIASSNIYEHGYDVTISSCSSLSDGEYYNNTGLNYSLGGGFLLFQFVHDDQTNKFYQLPYWDGGAYSGLTDIHTNFYQLGIGSEWEYLYTPFVNEIELNNGYIAISNSSVKIEVTPWVIYEEYNDYDDGNGSNPAQGQNDDNVGGDGTHDNSSDDLDENDYNKGDNDSAFGPQLNDPNWNSGTTLYTLFKMTFTQVGNLITYLTGASWQSTVTQLGLGSVFGAIQKCLTVPFEVNSSFDGYGLHILGINTNVATSGVVNHIQSVDCGEITIDRYFGDFKDYNPYTRVFVYLPYIGVNELNCNQIMGKSLNLTYGVDLLDGSCVARLTADGVQLASYSGNCATEYPIVGKSGLNPLQAVSNLVGLNYGENLGALTGLTESLLTKGGSSASTFQTVGGIAGNWGNVGVLTPFVYIERPVQSIPNSYDSSFGWTCNKYLPLNVLSGYTEVDESIHLSTTATDEEKEMLKEILTTGFYINDSE